MDQSRYLAVGVKYRDGSGAVSGRGPWISGAGVIFRPRISGSGTQNLSGSVSGFGFQPWGPNIDHFE